MAWVRIHDGALSNPKITGLIDLRNPFTLWVWGLSHSQMHLTDGIIVTEAVPKLALKAAAELVRRRLWETHDLGWKVHNYLRWNDCREVVMDRQTKAKDRKEAWRAKRSDARRERVPDAVTDAVTDAIGTASGTFNQTKPNLTKPKEREDSLSARDAFTDEAVTTRAGAFVRRYAEIYPAHRHGARYAVKPTRDYAAAVTLCETWADDARLEKLAVCFLTTDHKFAAEGSRTIPQFLALASWCDGELAKWEAGRT